MESGVPIVNHLPDFEGRDRLYDTLDEESRHIRVIELLGSNDRESPLQCRLITTDLEAARRQYTALSYYWGDLDSTEVILVKRAYPTVDETRFEVPITSALAAGLREIRAQATTRAPSTCLWVDAICINQTNIPERNYQVKIMYDIFAASHGVVGWLGELTTEIDQSLSWLIGLYTWKEVPVDINPSVREQFSKIQTLSRLISRVILEVSLRQRRCWKRWRASLLYWNYLIGGGDGSFKNWSRSRTLNSYVAIGLYQDLLFGHYPGL